MYQLSLFVAALVWVCVEAGKNDIYSGYTVHGVKIRDQSDQEFLRELQQSLDLDVWAHGAPGGNDATLMLSPDVRSSVLGRLDERYISHYLNITDLSQTLDDYDKVLNNWKNSRSRTDTLQPYEDFPRHAEVDAYLERIASENPGTVTLTNAGQSSEGRAIKYLRISSTNFETTTKPIIFITAMIRSREWVTTPVALYAIHRLVEDIREQDQDLLEDIDWIILPIVNPDGYEYSHTENRMWRRTRSFNSAIHATCYGVDANNNFDFNFNIYGSESPCSDLYSGEEAFSEPETRIVRDILLQYATRTQLYIDLQSYGSMIHFGFGDGNLPVNTLHLYLVASSMGAVMNSLKDPSEWSYYTVANSYILAPNSGSAVDYAYSVGVPFAYALILRDHGHAYMVPPEELPHITSETWEGLATAARLARSFFNARAVSEIVAY